MSARSVCLAAFALAAASSARAATAEEPTPAVDEEGREADGTDVRDVADDDDDLAERAALAGEDTELESIAVRLRRLRAARAGHTLWPRVALSLSFVRGEPARLVRQAGTPDTLRLDRHEGLAWWIVATWGPR